MSEDQVRYFLSYSGVKLPLRLVSPLEPEAIENRNTYFTAQYDQQERLVLCRKMVYGEVEFEHRYTYHDNGTLSRAEIDTEDEIRMVEFDEQGAVL